MVSHFALCQALLRHFKVSNLQRNFSSLHGNINLEFPKGTELRKNKLITLKSEAEKQKQFFQKFMKHSETVTLASYQMAWNIVRAKKPYNDGEFASREGTIALWKSVPMEKYPNVKQAALKILKMFGSTYVCESVFSTLKYEKSKHRSVLTDTYIKELLRVARTEYKPYLKKIAQYKECQKSH